MADVASTLRGWSATPASNLPAGGTPIGTSMDDNLRELQAVVRKYLASTGTNMASATTVDLATADGWYVAITGTTTITGLGTESAGIHYLLRFAGALTFTHNATSLILPGGVSITTAAGDMALMVSEGSGNWRCVNYLKANASFAQSGSAPIYGARAWARFNGTTAGTNAPTAGGNVTSIARNGVGDYTVTFTTALPSANFAAFGMCGTPSSNSAGYVSVKASSTPTTTTLDIVTLSDAGVARDFSIVSLAVMV